MRRLSKLLCFSLLMFIYSCSYYESTIIDNCPEQIPKDIHPVEFLWHIDENLIFNTYDNVIQPLHHSFLKPEFDGYYMKFEIAKKERQNYQFGENFTLLDNCNETWYSVERIDNYHFELYLNNYCYDTMLDLHQILFIVEIIFL